MGRIKSFEASETASERKESFDRYLPYASDIHLNNFLSQIGNSLHARAGTGLKIKELYTPLTYLRPFRGLIQDHVLQQHIQKQEAALLSYVHPSFFRGSAWR